MRVDDAASTTTHTVLFPQRIYLSGFFFLVFSSNARVWWMGFLRDCRVELVME